MVRGAIPAWGTGVEAWRRACLEQSTRTEPEEREKGRKGTRNDSEGGTKRTRSMRVRGTRGDGGPGRPVQGECKQRTKARWKRNQKFERGSVDAFEKLGPREEKVGAV